MTADSARGSARDAHAVSAPDRRAPGEMAGLDGPADADEMARGVARQVVGHLGEFYVDLVTEGIRHYAAMRATPAPAGAVVEALREIRNRTARERIEGHADFQPWLIANMAAVWKIADAALARHGMAPRAPAERAADADA